MVEHMPLILTKYYGLAESTRNSGLNRLTRPAYGMFKSSKFDFLLHTLATYPDQLFTKRTMMLHLLSCLNKH